MKTFDENINSLMTKIFIKIEIDSGKQYQEDITKTCSDAF